MDPARILLINLPGMGDTLMFTPTLQPLRARFPHAHITALVMHESSRQVLAGNPCIDRIVHYDFMRAGKAASLRYFYGLRRERLDVSLTSFPSNRLDYNAAAFLIGARLRIGHRYQHQTYRNLPWLLHQVVRETGDRHNIEENLQLLGPLGIDISRASRDPVFMLTSKDERFAAEFWQTHGLNARRRVVGLHTWSTEFKNMHRKCWTRQGFAALVDRLADGDDCTVLLFEGPHDAAANDAIARLCRHQPLRATGLAVGQTAALLKRCHALVTNDSGVMHLAAAVKTPTVAIFGPTDHVRTGPYGPLHRVIRKGLPCSPCFYYSPRPLTCPAGLDYACMQDITADEVFAAVQSLLGN
jgi:heptosyltransferase-2